MSFKAENSGALLFDRYFDATPVNGYSIQRGLTPAKVTDQDASILRQGVNWHQSKDYDLALVSLRAYLESNPVPATGRPLLLAATAAIAIGEYEEAAGYLAEVPRVDAATRVADDWYTALLALRKEDLAAARPLLEKIAKDANGRNYAAKDLLKALSAK